MKIVKLKQTRDDYQVVFENEQVLTLNDDMIVRYRLIPGTDVDDKLFTELTELSINYTAIKKTIKYINIRIRSLKEINQYLDKLGVYNKKLVIDELSHFGYIDDDRYAKLYVNDQINLTSNGPHKIKKALLAQNISEEVIFKYLDISNVLWQEKVNKLLNKKVKTIKNSSSYMIKNKLLEYAINMGYSKEMITIAINQMEFNEDDLLDKTIDKLINKYSEEQIIKKCQRLGFNYYEIVNKINEKKS